ncbi:MAG: 7TM domain-containing protein [Bacteroidota bacterium]
MRSNQSYYYIALLLIVLPIALMGWKYSQQPLRLSELLPDVMYRVNYHFQMDELDKEATIKAYVPQNSSHQSITDIRHTGNYKQFHKDTSTFGTRALWDFAPANNIDFSYQFTYAGKAVQYQLPDELPFEHEFLDISPDYLLPSEYIESTDLGIIKKAQQLQKTDVIASLRNNYDFLYQMPKSETSELTSARTTLIQNNASCNGKSRLFVALCRAQGIPARVVGGLILQQTTKKTSHLWAEAYVHGNWIPFDVLNGHYATLPANYLQLYTGDEFLITRTASINFDYQFDIEKQTVLAPKTDMIGMDLWALPTLGNLSFGLLRSLLLLPLATLLVALLRNVIGIKTFGVFLPALIALALVNVGLWWGLATFSLVVVVVSSLHFPLNRWGLLYTPKLVIMLTGVVVTLLAFSYLGVQNNWVALAGLSLFPVVILSITAERFARTIAEDGYADAVKKLGQTFLVTIVCYPIFANKMMVGFFLTYPEFYAVIIGTMLLLGRWIGLRVSEYQRFAWLSQRA